MIIVVAMTFAYALVAGYLIGYMDGKAVIRRRAEKEGGER